jgi:hypothetical protein
MNPRLLQTFVAIVACGEFAFPATMEGSAGPNPALNAYSKLVKDIIGQRWYQHVEASGPKSRLAGKVVVDFRIASSGLVENLRVVSNTTSQQWADIAVQSIKEAKFPPIPKDALQGHRWLDVKNMSFGSQDGDSAPQALGAYNEGLDAYNKGDYEKAIALYTKAIGIEIRDRLQ